MLEYNYVTIRLQESSNWQKMSCKHQNTSGGCNHIWCKCNLTKLRRDSWQWKITFSVTKRHFSIFFPLQVFYTRCTFLRSHVIYIFLIESETPFPPRTPVFITHCINIMRICGAEVHISTSSVNTSIIIMLPYWKFSPRPATVPLHDAHSFVKTS